MAARAGPPGAKGSEDESEGPEQVETLYSITEGWLTDEFKGVATQLQASLREPTGAQDELLASFPTFDSDDSGTETDDEEDSFIFPAEVCSCSHIVHCPRRSRSQVQCVCQPPPCGLPTQARVHVGSNPQREYAIIFVCN